MTVGPEGPRGRSALFVPMREETPPARIAARRVGSAGWVVAVVLLWLPLGPGYQGPAYRSSGVDAYMRAFYNLVGDSAMAATYDNDIDVLLKRSTALHHHLCPRQVLGVRTGMLAARLLDLPLPQDDKRVFAIVETDGCYADGVSVATGCWLGRRTLRLYDWGKVAATVADTRTGRAFRIAPAPDAREAAREHAPDEKGKWRAQLKAYRTMPDDSLLVWEPVTLTVDLQAIVSRPGLRVPCARCGEDVMNAREIEREGIVFCARCAGVADYYISLPKEERMLVVPAQASESRP
jgi:formylmethanofuran dehydrogenase subunit E